MLCTSGFLDVIFSHNESYRIGDKRGGSLMRLTRRQHKFIIMMKTPIGSSAGSIMLGQSLMSMMSTTAITVHYVYFYLIKYFNACKTAHVLSTYTCT